MANNRLTTIASNTFTIGDLSNFRELDLSDNRLIFPAQQLQSPFKPLKSLKYLNLRNNSIEHVYEDFSLAMTQLKELDLSYNLIRRVKFQSLQFHGQATEVNLNHNRITDIDFSSFVNLAGLLVSPRRS